MTNGELYAFAITYKHKSWARRWLKANGYWRDVT
jgi:hypothetical protein